MEGEDAKELVFSVLARLTEDTAGLRHTSCHAGIIIYVEERATILLRFHMKKNWCNCMENRTRIESIGLAQGRQETRVSMAQPAEDARKELLRTLIIKTQIEGLMASRLFQRHHGSGVPFWRFDTFKKDTVYGTSCTGEAFRIWYNGKWIFEQGVDTLMTFETAEPLLSYLHSRYTSLHGRDGNPSAEPELHAGRDHDHQHGVRTQGSFLE